MKKIKKYNTKSKSKINNEKCYVYNGETYLIIVESPSKCAKIESYLGSKYKCVATCGHLSSLKSCKNFEPIYEYAEDKSDHIYNLQKIAENFNPENILIATDMDREGETIAYFCWKYLLRIEKIDNVKRIIFNEITQKALLNAVCYPQSINMSLVHSQQARQMLDVIIGYKI